MSPLGGAPLGGAPLGGNAEGPAAAASFTPDYVVTLPAAQTIAPRSLVLLDPSDKRIIVFDFDATNLPDGVTLASYTVTVTPIRQRSQAASLTYDNAQLLSDSRRVALRMLATTASLGDYYTVAVKGLTSEVPEQDKEYSISVLIEAQ